MTFVEFARTHGLEIDRLRSGDRIFRCPTTAHPRSKNGAYAFDGKRGWVQNWETGEALQWWNDPTARPWTDAEKREWERKRQRDAAERAALAKKERLTKRAS
jgi:putative DNA primase/helicase